ncbi:MAG: tRNA (guanosine(46)-N7)-methyltransferase TrmB [Gammaproteobacteria bacterium]|nr:tRNA (guanosine(46)-N7)-methyltransferase TrmB [Gammaproteobacteria bacterium]MDH5727941.1 tRNA (guanosine(46)-N7)-methyltransferase TrmB [Gammaproteobacteria bacterium]
MSQEPIHKRTVRSFVRREGRLTLGQERALTDYWPRYGIEASDGLLDFQQIFGRIAPVHLEIGFGKGECLLAQAVQHPEINFVGVEVFRPGAGHLIHQLQEHNCNNAKVVLTDAVEFLQKQVPDKSLDRVCIFFADPWHKKKHHKRRLIQASFIHLLTQKLKFGGELYLATDWQHYADHMREVLLQEKRLENIYPKNDFAPRANFRPLTKFEKRGQGLGHEVWDLAFRRK